MIRLFGFGKGVGMSLGVVVLFAAAGWAQPEFQRMPVKMNFNIPGLLYIEDRPDIGKKVLMQTYSDFGYWRNSEICRAPYMDIVYSGKGAAFMAAGDSADNCHIYSMDIVNGHVKAIFDKAVKNPWADKRYREWIRTEPIAASIFMLYDQPDSANMLLISYNYALQKMDKKEISKSHFGDALKGDFHVRIAPDGQHIAFLTKPKAIPDKPGAYESSLKVLHFSNMTVTDATKSIVTYVSGDQDDAWPAFDFQALATVHYFTMEPLADGSKTQISMIYKAVDIELNTNTEILSTILPLPQNAGTLFRHPENYYMLYDHFAPTPKRIVVDHEKTQTMLVYPEPGQFTLSREADIVTVKCDNKTLLSAPNQANTLLDGIVSYYDNRAFCIGSDDPATPGTQIWFYDPRDHLYAVGWTPNKVTLVGVMEVSDPLKKKL